MLLVLLCLFKDTCTAPFLGWPTIFVGSSWTTQTLTNCSAYFFKVGFNIGVQSVLLSTVTMRHSFNE